MAPTRQCPLIKLSKQPLILVLAQVRFSPIANLAQYMPSIQDCFRRGGYPFQTRRKNKSFELTIEGIRESEAEEQWLFKTKEEKTSLIIDNGQIVLQTTEYDTFEPYVERLLDAKRILFSGTEHDRYGIVQRIGLRYIDVIRHQPDDGGNEFYLQSSLLGIKNEAFLPDTKRIGGETIGKTSLGNDCQGTLVVRITQNNLGMDLPPDLIQNAPPRSAQCSPGQLLTLLDTDHFWEGKLDPQLDLPPIPHILYRLHDKIVDTFRNHLVTTEALASWE